MAISLAACSTTDVKVNGYKVNSDTSEKTSSKIPEPLIAIGVIGLGVLIGITIIGGGDGPSGEPDTTYQDCLAAGLPEPHCRSISI